MLRAGHDDGRDQVAATASPFPTRRAASRSPRPFTAETTFLGAHVVPAEFAGDPTGTSTSSPARCSRPARRTPAGSTSFCEPRAPSTPTRPARCWRPGAAPASRRGCTPASSGPDPGALLAAELGAASADHCTHLTDADVGALRDAGIVATLLPGAEFSTRSPYPDARRLLDAGVTVALATDCNPGTRYTISMPFCVALAVREMAMTPAEALRVGDVRAAPRRCGVDDVGVLAAGARADLALLDAPSHVHLAYRPGVPLVGAVVRGGVRVA